jgi:hypothetical protein
MKAGINLVKVRLDKENDEILTKSGISFYLDTSYQPEQHLVLWGTVEALPCQLKYSDRGNAMPWLTDMELQIGDKVVMYYMAVFNCLSNERRHYIKEATKTWIFVNYRNIYAIERDGKIIPVNGYVLVEPMEDPEWERQVKQYRKSGLTMPDLREPTNKGVVYGRVAHVGHPNRLYYQPDLSDDDIEISPGDRVVMKKIRDIPLEYEYHTKMEGGKKLYRAQRHDILAVL